MSSQRVVFGVGIEAVIPSKKLHPGTKLYIAGPQGFMEATRPFHRKVIEVVEMMGGQALDPWTLTSQKLLTPVMQMPLGEKQVRAWEQLNKVIAENNLQAIRESTGVVANLDGTDVDSGTAAEIGAAFVLGKPIIGYRGDFRLARDNMGGTVNLQVEHFIRQSGQGSGNIIHSISQLPRELLRIWGLKKYVDY